MAPRALLLPAILLAASALAAGCLNSKTDKCYVPMARYEPLRDLFLETGSIQRVNQRMEEEKWAPCERNQLRYMLAKDLYLDDLIDEIMASN